MNLNLEVANLLRAIREGAYNPDLGICGAMIDLLKDEERPIADCWYSRLSYAFKAWPEYSDDYTFPIPSTMLGVSPETAFWNLPKWDRKHPYSLARWRLLDHLITWFEGSAA